jgi:dTDP-4-dehydrorhamnose reductase
MSSERGLLLPSFDDALARYLREREISKEQAGSVEALRQLSGRT